MRILHNCKIYGHDARDTALAIEKDRIVAIGSDAELLNAGTGIEKEDLYGRYVMPGITDSHIHLDLYAQSLQYVDCAAATRQECLQRVAYKTNTTPPGTWIHGHGWNQNLWSDGFASAQELDGVTSNHPVFLTDKSLHCAWVNSKALSLAGIDATTPDPFGGTIQRDSQGIPTGILFEKAVDLVEKIIPPLPQDQLVKYLRVAQEKLLSYGVTSVHDFDRIPCFSALQQMDADGTLILRVLKSIPVEQLDSAVSLSLMTGYGNAHLRIGSIKMFSDGALGPHTAAMLWPYEGNPDQSGTLLLSSQAILDAGIKAGRSGLSLAIHAIGDRATREVLQGFALLRQYETAHELPHLMHRIEHMQLVDPADIPLAARLGICLSMQPVHLYMDMSTADRIWGDRSRYAYALRSLQSTGAMIIFGSDAPVETPNPFWGIHAAVSRRTRDMSPVSASWYPQELISLSDALRYYTETPQIQAGMTGRAGRLEPGYLADLLVLDENLLSIPAEHLHQVKPTRVMVDGSWVHQI